MHVVDLILAAGAFLTGGFAARRLWRLPDLPFAVRASLAVVAALGSFIVVFAIGALWLSGPGDPWNAARLTPAIALHHGYQLYYPITSGPVLSTVVGPMAFLPYWPVGFFRPASPTALVLAATFLNLIALAFYVRWMLRQTSAFPSVRCLAALIAAQLALAYASLRYSLFTIHADAPALLLGGLGVGVIALGPPQVTWRRAILAGFCIAGAVWAKQSIAPIYVALILITFLQGGRTATIRIIGASAATGLLVSMVFVGWIGFAVLRDNMFVVPAVHPWMQMSLSTGEIYPHLTASDAASRLKVISAAMLHLLRSNWPLFAVLGVALVEHALNRSPEASRWPRGRWPALLIVALCLFPTAAIGRTKVGGEVNHESFVLFFLLAAIVLWLVESSTKPPRQVVRLGLVLALLSAINAPRALEYAGWKAAWNNQNEMAFRYQQNNPDRVYFPWNPLTSLLAGGKVYHFDYGVFDRNLGGATVSPGHIAQALPSPRPIIASFVAHHDHILHRYFPDYVSLPPDPDLPGWRLYGSP